MDSFKSALVFVTVLAYACSAFSLNRYDSLAKQGKVTVDDSLISVRIIDFSQYL